MSCLILKSIKKYRRHPSITAIQDAYKGGSFSFSTVEKVDIIRESKHLNKKKATHDNTPVKTHDDDIHDGVHDDDIPAKILKENVNFFTDYICTFYNSAKTTSKFPFFLKIAHVTPIFKK